MSIKEQDLMKKSFISLREEDQTGGGGGGVCVGGWGDPTQTLIHK